MKSDRLKNELIRLTQRQQDEALRYRSIPMKSLELILLWFPSFHDRTSLDKPTPYDRFEDIVSGDTHSMSLHEIQFEYERTDDHSWSVVLSIL